MLKYTANELVVLEEAGYLSRIKNFGKTYPLLIPCEVGDIK